MALLLNIDTSTETAFVSLSYEGSTIAFNENAIQKDHAAFIHPAIQSIMAQAGKRFEELDAIAVTAGPGSYTGIRVGMATAKGLCFALNKPLILLNTLEILARDVIHNVEVNGDVLYCPMIDARRMEVYTALYDRDGNEIAPPTALVVDETFFRKFTTKYRLIVFGNGALKCKKEPAFKDAIFTENVNIINAMCHLSNEKYRLKSFNDVVFSEPFYLKDFFDARR